jgi:replication factor A1
MAGDLKMNIADLSAGQNDVEMTAEVISMEEPREVTTKFGTRVTLVNTVVKDDSGEMKLTLWGKQADGVAVGKKVEIKNGFVKDFRGEPQLGIGKQGSIAVVE